LAGRPAAGAGHVRVRLRPAGARDIGRLIVLMRRLYAHDRLPWRPRPARAALAGLLRDRRRGRAWLVEAGGATAGYLVVTLGWSLEYLGLDAFIDEFYLEPAWRGRGVGLAAVRLAQTACRRLGVRALHLEVERRNRAPQRFYRRARYVEHDRYLMTRLLGARQD
jgi:GNAT superfamily N-acetyltransferase